MWRAALKLKIDKCFFTEPLVHCCDFLWTYVALRLIIETKSISVKSVKRIWVLYSFDHMKPGWKVIACETKEDSKERASENGHPRNVGMEANRETVNLKELAYMRRRAVEGRSTRSTSSRVVTSRAHHRQASYQLQNDNKSLDFVYYSDSEDEAVDGNGIFNDSVQITNLTSAEPQAEESSYAISCNFVDCLANRWIWKPNNSQHATSSERCLKSITLMSLIFLWRERGCDRKFQTMRLASEYGTRYVDISFA